MKILYVVGDDPKEMGCGTKVRTHYLWSALDVALLFPDVKERLFEA